MPLIENAISEHITPIKNLLNSIDLFPSEMLDDMINNYISGQAHHEIWLVATEQDKLLGFAYGTEEMMTDGTYNLLALGVDPAQQGKGIGKALIQQMEQTMRVRGGRIMIIETSGTDAFASTRTFYEGLEFKKVASIPDFWATDDAKVIYWKKIID